MSALEAANASIPEEPRPSSSFGEEQSTPYAVYLRGDLSVLWLLDRRIRPNGISVSDPAYMLRSLQEDQTLATTDESLDSFKAALTTLALACKTQEPLSADMISTVRKCSHLVVQLRIRTPDAKHGHQRTASPGDIRNLAFVLENGCSNITTINIEQKNGPQVTRVCVPEASNHNGLLRFPAAKAPHDGTLGSMSPPPTPITPGKSTFSPLSASSERPRASASTVASLRCSPLYNAAAGTTGSLWSPPLTPNEPGKHNAPQPPPAGLKRRHESLDAGELPVPKFFCTDERVRVSRGLPLVESRTASPENAPTTPARLALRAYLIADGPRVAHQFIMNHGITLTDEQLGTHIAFREEKIWDVMSGDVNMFRIETRAPSPSMCSWRQALRLCGLVGSHYRKMELVVRVCGPWVKPGLVFMGDCLVEYARAQIITMASLK
ncbi:hypothetical protein LTR08_007165 [Meristemomyces frigidus]|nr:hypothetical protein LTR08_007165 [Meristemomyces frigidus]